MDKELIERLAAEAGMETSPYYRPAPDVLQRFAAAVAEECANVADDSDEYIGERIREKFKP